MEPLRCVECSVQNSELLHVTSFDNNNNNNNEADLYTVPKSRSH